MMKAKGWVTISTDNEDILIQISHITKMHQSADGDYTEIYFSDGTLALVRRPIGEVFSDILSSQ